jgi:hypothetical protein
MYAVTPLKSPPHSAHINDGPITDFAFVIETVPAEQWQKRTNALQKLVTSIPNGIQGVDTAWYNSPKYIRHLANPLADLLKDARSSVVKRTCDACTELFQKCGPIARYLLKDLMPTILGAHAQTVTVIRNAVEEMVTTSLANVPCKSVMPLWLERIKSDKSRTVREACAVYLSLALESWTDENYLTSDIKFQVGNSLIRAMRDASPTVRTEAKRGVEYIRVAQPDVWHRLLHDPEGPAAEDPKLKRLLSRMSMEESVDSLSVASRGSFASQRQMFPPRHRSARPVPTAVVIDDGNSYQTKSTIPKRSGLGPPLRVNVSHAPFGSTAGSPHHQTRSPDPQQRYKVGSPRRIYSPELEKQQNGERLDTYTYRSSPSNLDIVTAETTTTVDTSAEEEPALHFDDEGPFIASVNELKKQATGRRSRRSSILQERLFRLSSSNLGSSNLVEPDESANPVTDSTPPEQLQIAEQLLEAHRTHVDKIMETLRMEMDALKEFEQLVIDESKPTRPTEEEVVDYFESVGLCLDQRTAGGKELQREMDRISKGVS